MEQERRTSDSTAKKIRVAAEEALHLLAGAAQEATKTIAAAAASAAAAALAVKTDDHDLLIELKTRLEGLRTDILDLKSGTSGRISDHEGRLNTLEASRARQNILISIGVGILTLLVSLLVYHIFKMG